MKRTSLVVAGFSAMVALGLIGYGCTSGDTVNNGTGGKGSGGSTSGGGQGGMTTSGGQGGMTTSGGQGGMTTSGGQGGSTTTGAGGSTTTGAGGSTTTGAGGSTTTGAGGSSGGLVTCPSPAPGDKSACVLGSVTTPCTKNCGIKNSLAQKPCACITSTVAPPSPTAWDCSGQGPCVYPTGFDKTCYALTPAPPACPAALVTGLTTCTNTAGATCGPLCGSATVPSYSTGTIAMPSAPKAGYCACVSGLWQCASVAEWPM